MQFTISATTFLALVSSVLAQTKDFDAITVPTDGQVLQAGEVCVITWEPTSTVGADTITIRLMQGADEGSLDFNPIDVACMSFPLLADSKLRVSIILTWQNSKHQQLPWLLLVEGRQQPGRLCHLRPEDRARHG